MREGSAAREKDAAHEEPVERSIVVAGFEERHDY
jgi:hypothetical protein